MHPPDTAPDPAARLQTKAARYVDLARNKGEALALRGALWARLALARGASPAFVEAVLVEASERWAAECARVAAEALGPQVGRPAMTDEGREAAEQNNEERIAQAREDLFSIYGPSWSIGLSFPASKAAPREPSPARVEAPPVTTTTTATATVDAAPAARPLPEKMPQASARGDWRARMARIEANALRASLAAPAGWVGPFDDLLGSLGRDEPVRDDAGEAGKNGLDNDCDGRVSGSAAPHALSAARPMPARSRRPQGPVPLQITPARRQSDNNAAPIFTHRGPGPRRGSMFWPGRPARAGPGRTRRAGQDGQG